MFNVAVNRLIESMSETTTSGDIAYLPSGFKSIRPMLYTLARMKKKWKIEVLEDKVISEYTVRFEDQFNIKVPFSLWEEFSGKMFNHKMGRGMVELDLSGTLQEAIDADVAADYEKLDHNLKILSHKLPFVNLNRSVVTWINLFGKQAYATGSDILLRWEKFSADTSKVYAELKNNYIDDRGSIEMINEALKQGTVLSTFEVFKRYNYLAGTMIRSQYQGIVLSLESTIDMAFNPAEVIRISNSDVVDKVEEEYGHDIGVARGVIYPRGKVFPIRFYIDLKNLIQEDITQKDNKDQEEE